MTPERRAELRALLVTAPEFIREDPLVRDMPALLDALDASDARERRLREALVEAATWFEEYAAGHEAKGALDKASRNLARANACRRCAALSEVAPDA